MHRMLPFGYKTGRFKIHIDSFLYKEPWRDTQEMN